MKLPPVLDQPLDSEQRLKYLGPKRLQFLKTLIGNRDVFHLHITATTVDVGPWFGKRRVTCCLLDREMVLFAEGPRAYVERIPFDQIQESQYNHVTGEVVLAPRETDSLTSLKVPPLIALEILANIRNGDDHGSA